MPDPKLPGLQQLQHVVVLMMENRSFDHMLGGLKHLNPAIDGLDDTETNPDSTGVPVTVSPNAEYQSQLDPDPTTTSLPSTCKSTAASPPLRIPTAPPQCRAS